MKPLFPVKRSSRRKLNRVQLAALIGLFLITFSVIAFMIRSNEESDEKFIRAVTRLAQVPENEQPVVRTIADKSKITQAFLSEAEEGDKVLVYTVARKAVLYRPSTNKIISIGPVEATPPGIFLRNGTSQASLAPVIEKLRKAPEEYRLISRDASPKKYSATFVVDLSGVRGSEAAQLAKTLGASVVALPEGESRADAELLVIVGSDQFTD